MTAACDAVVGVDGGNSKTDVVVADRSGRVLAQVRGPGTQPYRVGVAQTCREVVAVVAQARAAAGVGPGPLAAGAFHWANLDTAAAEEEAAGALRGLGAVERLSVRNDTFAVLRAGAPDGWGVAVVAGAGVNACAVAPDGRTARFLALGALTGDWGGGAAIAVAALGAAVRAGDGRGPATSLRDLLPPVLGTATVEDAALAIEDRRLPRSVLHALPPVVSAAAQAGDGVATGILHRQADEVVVMVEALLDRLDLTRAAVPVVLGGGVLQHGPPLLLDRIVAAVGRVAPRATVEVLAVRPVAGPVLEALDLAGGHDPAAAARVRGALPAG